MTLLEKARKGIVTDEMVSVARYEGLSAEYIREGLAEGTIIIPKNNTRTLGIYKGNRQRAQD